MTVLDPWIDKECLQKTLPLTSLHPHPLVFMPTHSYSLSPSSIFIHDQPVYRFPYIPMQTHSSPSIDIKTSYTPIHFHHSPTITHSHQLSPISIHFKHSLQSLSTPIPSHTLHLFPAIVIHIHPAPSVPIHSISLLSKYPPLQIPTQ